MNQKVYIGKNAIIDWWSDLQTIAPKHCFVVRGHRSFEACGGQEVIEQLQKKTHCQITEFEDFSVNPKYEEVQIGLEKLLQSKADMIVAIGGGSVLDMSKLIRHMAMEQGYKVPLHAMPTTAGTGAEATHFAVVYIDGKKQSIAAEDVLPDVAVVYPPFTYSNSIYQTACAGFDAVAQAIESFWAKGATEESRQYSVRALALLWKQLPQLIKAPTDELRDQIAEGAYWAGRAINISTTTAPHAFSYAFTSHYGYPHGHAVALTFPFFMKLNGTKELYELLGVSADNAMQKIAEYISSLGLSLQLEHTIDIQSTLQEVNLQRLSNNPVVVTSKIIVELESYLKSHQQEDLSRYNPEGSTLRKAQLRMVDILVEVDKICRKHKIEYYLDWGSLLGAVRHGGFIPWDDDLDITVRGKDVNRLRKLLQAELPSNLCYQDYHTDWNCPIPMGKVRDKKSIFDDPYLKKVKERGIFIDVFAVENVVPLKLKNVIDFVYIRCIRGVHNYSDRFVEKFLGYICYPPTILCVWMCRLWAKLLGLRHWGHQYGWKSSLYVPEDVIFPVREINFEGHTFYAPNDYDTYLRTLYGDYMQIPPEDKRVTHLAEITFLDERE